MIATKPSSDVRVSDLAGLRARGASSSTPSSKALYKQFEAQAHREDGSLSMSFQALEEQVAELQGQVNYLDTGENSEDFYD